MAFLTTHGPVHAGPLKPGADQPLCSQPRGRRWRYRTLGAKFRVTHARGIVEAVQRHLAALGQASARRAWTVHAVCHRRVPCMLSLVARNRLSGSVQSYSGVVPIENLSSLGEQLAGGVPNPSTVIARHHAMGSLVGALAEARSLNSCGSRTTRRTASGTRSPSSNLQRREDTIPQIHSVSDAERRKQWVRHTLLAVI